MNIFTYFKKMGINTIGAGFYSKIQEWEDWYQGYVPKFHQYCVYNGNNKIRRRRYSLGMAKKVCEDIADLLLNERVKITISKSDSTAAFVKDVLEYNNFTQLSNEFQERKAYSGTVAYIPQLDGVEITEAGEVMSGGNIKINYVQGKNIFPISWENGRIKEAAFLFPKTVNRKKYVLIQIHRLKATETGKVEYVIDNDVVECTNGSGSSVPYEKWEELEPFKGLAQSINTGSDQRQFVMDKLNIVNNADEDDTNPMGIAIFANTIDILSKLDLEFDSYANEFDLGRKRIFVAPELLENDNGDPVFDSNDTVFYQLPDGALQGGQPIKDVNMELRTDAHSMAINDDLNLLSFRVGFGTQRYKFEHGSVTTATQIISENSDMYRTIKKHEIVLDGVIKELIHIIIRLGIVAKYPGLTEDVEIAIDFDDSIIEDKQAERQQDMQDVSMGIMSNAEYRAKWYGETLEKAKQKLPEQNNAVISDLKLG